MPGPPSPWLSSPRHARVVAFILTLSAAVATASPASGHAWPPTATSPHFFPFDCTKRPTNTTLLLAALADPPPPAGHALPAWVTATCPAVAAHFAAFPLFHAFHPVLPVSTTAYAAAGACTLQLTLALAHAAGVPTPLLHAGAHLGALLHGGPIPWDDDIDALLPWSGRQPFLAACASARHAVHPSVSLICHVSERAIKVFVRPRGGGGGGGSGGSGGGGHSAAPVSSPTRLGWSAPFVDLFLYKLTDGGRTGGRLVEVSARTGASSDNAWPARLAAPPRLYYFAGLAVPGPPPSLAHARYDTRACVSAAWNHRAEDWVPEPVRNLRLDCCALAAAGFPFIVRAGDGRAALVGPGGRALAVDHLGGQGDDDGPAGALASASIVDAEAVPLVIDAAPRPPPPRPLHADVVAAVLAAGASVASLAAVLAHARRERRGAPARAAVRDVERE